MARSATKEIRKNQKWASLPIIALTANVFANEKNDFLNAGMNDHVGKPIDPDELLSTLAKWVRPTQPAVEAVLSVSPRTVAIGSLPNLPGVKVAESVRRIAGNVDLYFTLLGKFRVNQRDVVNRIRESLNLNDSRTAERLAHTLRGIAGNLGAEALHKQAEHLEKGINTNQLDEVELLLTKIDIEISNLISNIDHVLNERDKSH